MSNAQSKNTHRNRKPRTPKHLRPTIKKDQVHPADWLKYGLTWSCADCVHFAPATAKDVLDDVSDESSTDVSKSIASCSIGYSCTHHLRENQIKSYELSGKIAFCRFHEVV